MKLNDFAKAHGVDPLAFELWLKQSKYPYKKGMSGLTIDDKLNADELVGAFNEHQEQILAARAQEIQEEAVAAQVAAQAADDAAKAAQMKQQALASMLITSGFNFDGYTITRYSGYISGDDVVSIERPTKSWGVVDRDVGEDLLGALGRIRRQALAEVKEAAYALGCNAVIGVDFDYLTLDPSAERRRVNGDQEVLYLPFLFAVTANGNAVVIEKNNKP